MGTGAELLAPELIGGESALAGADIALGGLGGSAGAAGLGVGAGAGALGAGAAAGDAFMPAALGPLGTGATGDAFMPGALAVTQPETVFGAGALTGNALGGAQSGGGGGSLSPGAQGALGTGGTPSAAPISTPASGPVGGSPIAGGSASSVTGGAAESGGSVIDKILKQMKDNPLGTAGAAIGAANLASGTKAIPNAAQLQGLGAQASGVASQLIQQYQSGQLSAGQQSSLDQLTQQTKNQIAQYFASIGQSDSTSAKTALAQVDQQAQAMKQQMLDNALQQGLGAIGVAQGPLNTVAQYQLGQDNSLRQAFGSFASAVGNAFGSKSGSTTPTPSTNATPTQPTPAVQSGGTQ